MKLDKKVYLGAVAAETARMSYPGRMGGMLRQEAKKTIQRYFEHKLLPPLWYRPNKVAKSFDKWHQLETKKFALYLRGKKLLKQRKRATGVATKLLNTFLYQLMKYKRFQSLYRNLHLPLDQRVFEQLRWLWNQQQPQALELVRKFLSGKEGTNPYYLSYKEYKQFQKALGCLREECWADRQRLSSRIELNALLWAVDRSPVAGHRSLWGREDTSQKRSKR